MAVVISLLRGVNVGGANIVKMDQLRVLYDSLGLLDTRTHLQSGNAVFRTGRGGLAQLAKNIENGIERSFGFHSDVILRTPAELREVVARNPFAGRMDIHPGRLLVTFFSRAPGREHCDRLLELDFAPEELHLSEREIYIYYPHGMARPKVPPARIEKILNISGTGRNWNTVIRLLEIGEELERV